MGRDIVTIQKNRIKRQDREIKRLQQGIADAEVIMRGMVEEYGNVAKNKAIIEKVGNLELPVVFELFFIIIKRKIQNLWRKKK